MANKKSKNVESGSESGDDEQEFVVERVCDKRVVNGVTQYYLKWKNYPE